MIIVIFCCTIEKRLQNNRFCYMINYENEILKYITLCILTFSAVIFYSWIVGKSPIPFITSSCR